MSDVAAQLRAAADLAERAAVHRQHAEFHGPRADPAVIGGLETAADTLRHAAKLLAPPPVASRRATIASVLMSSVWVISCVVFLSAVPNPAQPWVLAFAVAGTGVLAKLTRDVVVAIRDRRDGRRLAAATGGPEDVRHAIAELRARIRVTTGALDPDGNDLHREVSRWLDSVRVWIDAADRAATETPGDRPRLR